MPPSCPTILKPSHTPQKLTLCLNAGILFLDLYPSPIQIIALSRRYHFKCTFLLGTFGPLGLFWISLSTGSLVVSVHLGENFGPNLDLQIQNLPWDCSGLLFVHIHWKLSEKPIFQNYGHDHHFFLTCLYCSE